MKRQINSQINTKLWANYNGPGKPLTKEQPALLARWGIKERFDENGKGYYLRADFEEVWKQLGITKS
jgi:hypothetical protein